MTGRTARIVAIAIVAVLFVTSGASIITQLF